MLFRSDLNILLNGNQDYQTLFSKFGVLATEIKKQVEIDKEVNIQALKTTLPDVDFSLTAGKNNPIYNISKQYKIEFDSLIMQMQTSAENGLFADADVFGLMRDTMKIDSICFILHQDTAGLLYDAKVIKKKYRQQQPFTADLNGLLRSNFARAEITLANDTGGVGFLIGAQVDLEKEGYRLHLFPDNPILAFRRFELNQNNFVFYKDIKDITANLRLTGEENASLWIHSTQNDAEERATVHVEISQINLAALSQSFQEFPDLRGMVSADLQYAPSDSSFTIM